MSRLRLTVAAAGLLGIVLAGCEHIETHFDDQIVPEGTISVHSLAGRLGMRVEQSSRTLASLSGRSNRVLVLGQPDSRVFVNGRAIGPTGQVRIVGDALFVPLSVEPQIRAALRGGSGVEIATAPPGEPRTPLKPEPPPTWGKPAPGSPVHGLVIIDAGHGGKDPGAMAGGVREKDLNLSVAQLVTEDLKARGAKVLMTRSGDSFVELEERADTANRASANLFLSIHTNSSPKASASGFSVYIAYAAGQTSVAAATDIANRVEQAGIASCGSQPKRAGYKVLVQNHRPAVLLEMGFITNSADVSNLSQARYQRMLADAVAEGIADYLRGR